jgi:hypothetical protein
VEFTGVELTSGAELTAPVEDDVASPVVKAATGPHALEGRSVREVWGRGRKMGCCAFTQWRCRLAEQRGGGEGGTMESAIAKAARAHYRAWSSRQRGHAAVLREVSFFNDWGKCEWMSI